MSAQPKKFKLFDVTGIELEYMVVDPIHGGVLPGPTTTLPPAN